MGKLQNKVQKLDAELRIQGALEKVRQVALTMKTSEDMLRVCRVIAFQLKSLGVQEIRNVQTAIFHPPHGTYTNYEYYAKHRKTFITETLYTNHKVHRDFAARMLRGKGHFYVTHIRGKKVKGWIAYQKTTNVFIDKYLEKASSLSYYWYSLGPVALGISTYKPLNREEQGLFRRFRNVFDLSYRRFLDIENAEARAKEARLEASLERVRSRTMAMHKSEEVMDIAVTLYDELQQLDFKFGAATIIIIDRQTGDMEHWVAGFSQRTYPVSYHMKYFAHPFYDAQLKAWKSNEKILAYALTGEQRIDWVKKTLDETDYRNFPESEKAWMKKIDPVHFTLAFMKHGALMWAPNPATPAQLDMLQRFATVFEQSYTRFLDLQKAEAQARESQIQLALERVRARTMAMQKSEELSEAVFILFQQFRQLGETPDQATIGIINEAERVIEYWVTMYGRQLNRVFRFSIDEPHVTRKIYDAWKRQEKSIVIDLSGKALEEFTAYRAGQGGAAADPEEKRRIINVAFFSKGLLNVQSNETRTGESIRLLERFASVFDQTYTRFLDLQRAEAQARESQVQLALERVRARTMAMQKSEELTDVAALLFKQVNDLGIKTWTTGFNVWNDDNESFTDYITSPQGDFIKPYTVQVKDSPLSAALAEARKRGEEFIVQYAEGETLKKNYDALTRFAGMPESEKMLRDGIRFPTHEYEHFVFGAKVSLIFVTYDPVPEAHDIFRRLGRVFEQTYTRFLDLQKAESQAREAQVETALERVRSRTLAMQRSDELAETASVLFRQLILLGIEPNRLYITIIKDDNGEAEFWITDEDGSKVSAAFAANLHDNPTFRKMYEGWKSKQKTLIIDMQGEELENYFLHLRSIQVPFKGGLAQKRRVQHIAYFSSGFIGMASPDEQPAETLQLLERFAYVLNLTFTRFNDLKIAEAHALQAEQDLAAIKAAKRKAEETLAELQLTQKQLIQSEKMASLGELTAGIAHEIQNPLNFVNNFSEVSNELMEEMKEELTRGNLEEAKAMIDSIKQNLDKINHHGKRADGIVKAMLQHSRTGSGQRELTDINSFCDEYLRLAYHGLRAKEKNFSARTETSFDPDAGTIKMVPQDIGRVLVNLLNNAFYAVGERRKMAESGYTPVVTLSTRKKNGNIYIAVSDNGQGIPGQFIDKIFQPFFSTKPTGQGTGLGLSLSYDIVKAHGGEITVETQEGSGTTVTVQLPLV